MGFLQTRGLVNPISPVVYGRYSVECYLSCLDACQKALLKKLEAESLFDVSDYFVFHSASAYLIRKGFNRMTQNDPQEFSVAQLQDLFAKQVEPGAYLCRELGATYTAACYVNIVSLVMKLGQALEGTSINVFSYGSGMASSMYRLRVRRLPEINDVASMLARRVFLKPEAFLSLAAESLKTYRQFGYEVRDDRQREADVYYLSEVDALGKRFYGLAGQATTSRQLPGVPPVPQAEVPYGMPPTEPALVHPNTIDAPSVPRPSTSSDAALATWPDRIDLRSLQTDFGSNFWLVSAAQLNANFEAWTRIAGDASRIAYPVKANPSPAVLEILAAHGARAECAASSELELARLAGFSGERLVYNSPAAEGLHRGAGARSGRRGRCRLDRF
ncbi:MAG: hydroxymethylglutaryl-CoA synthase [Myxococcota bacterium]